jgi:hypothetical protein
MVNTMSLKEKELKKYTSNNQNLVIINKKAYHYQQIIII